MTENWENWSGSLRFSPQRIAKPESEQQIQELVREIRSRGGNLRVVGKGHSSSSLVRTEDTLVSLEKMTGVQSVDRETRQAWARPGSTLEELGEQLLEEDLAIHNQGDVNVQQLGGAIGTGTHGTGNMLGILSTMVLGVRMVTANGEIIERNIEDDEEFIRAARVGLGTLGIFTSVRIQAEPAFKLYRREWCTSVEDCLAHLDELNQTYRNFDFYWYPRSDEVKLRTLNPPQEDNPDIPYADLLKESCDWGPRILSKSRHLKFDEMEYALPEKVGPEVFLAVRERMRKVHRRDVGWRTLYRTSAADDAMLSPSYERPTVTVSLHHNAGLEFEPFFRDIEPIFNKYQGRPHWGKKHYLTGQKLAELYPEWERFQRIRRQMDPEGLFLTDYLRRLFGE